MVNTRNRNNVGRKKSHTTVSFDIFLIDMSNSRSKILEVRHIAVSIPIHTDHVGNTFDEIVIPTNISFEDFSLRVSAKMGLESETVLLCYKFNKDLRRNPYQDLANEHQLRIALARGADLIKRARKRRVVLEIQNRVSISPVAMYLRMLKYDLSLTGLSLPHRCCYCGPEGTFRFISFYN
jgi:hypothetical protein